MLHRALAALALAVLASCSSIEPPEVYHPSALAKINTAYVVKHEDSSKGVDLALQNAVAKHRIRASTGPMSRKPSNVDVYITYVDRWSWDVTMFLKSLDVSIYKNGSNELIATGSFENGIFFHAFPDVEDTAFDVIASIFGERRLPPAPPQNP